MRAVVFDIGNVLIEWDRRFLYEKILPEPADLDRFLRTVYTLEANEMFDRGQHIDEFTTLLAAKHPLFADAIYALRTRWIETLGPVIQGTLDILVELSEAQVPLYALSNFNDGTFRLIEDRYDFFRLFRGMVISGRVGHIKPERKIYELLCDEYDLDPIRTVFIDDSAQNVAAAILFGIDGVLFESPDQLRLALIDRGLLTGSGRIDQTPIDLRDLDAAAVSGPKAGD